MEKLAKWLEKSSHRLTKLKGSPIVLNQVANGYIAATRLINMEIMGQKFNHRALENPWVPSLHTLWLECVDLRISSGQTINLPNLKVLHLRDVVMLNPIAENAAAANKKLKTDNLGLVNILKGCRTTLEFLELYTIDISGIVHFGQNLPKLKELKLVRSNDEDGLKALFEACKTSLEKLVHQEMVLHCLEDFLTHMECLKRIETDCDINGITLIKKCASTLEYLDVKSFDGANNFLGFDTPLPALKSIKACHSRGGRLGLGRLVALSCQTLETLCIEKINLYHEMRIISFQLPCLKTLRISKCEGEEPVIQLLRASQHSIETLVTESLTCRFPSSIDFDMPNLKFVTVGLCKRDVMHTLQVSHLFCCAATLQATNFPNIKLSLIFR